MIQKFYQKLKPIEFTYTLTIFINEIIILNKCSGETKIEIQLIAKFKIFYYQTP